MSWSEHAHGLANQITALRLAMVVVAFVALMVAWPALPVWAWWTALAAWLLDAVDGLVARRTGTTSRVGYYLDLECDAALLVVLALAAAPVVGWWVLGIGALRYAFGLTGRLWAPLRAPLPYDRFRRVVAAVQAGALLLALISPVQVGRLVAGVALGLLCISFGRDVVYLVRRR